MEVGEVVLLVAEEEQGSVLQVVRGLPIQAHNPEVQHAT